MATKKAGKAKPAKTPKKPKTAAKSKANPVATEPARKADRRIELFVAEYLIDLNGARAAIAAGYSPKAARQQASEMLARPDVQALVDAAMKARAERLQMDADAVLRRLAEIAEADPRELIELHRCCCRYCYGEGHYYQFTAREMDRARDEHDAQVATGKAAGEFVAPGGIGYNPKRPPNEDCPECHGLGQERVIAKDTRTLSPAARRLYAGVKMTQNGLQVLTHSQVDALTKLGQHHGLFKSVVTGPNGGPVEHNHTYSAMLDEVEGADTGTGPARSRRE